MVMPADLHLSVVSSRPPNSYTVALSADVLPLNLSPAAVSSLLTITNAMKAAARLPQGKSSAQPRAQPLAQPLAEARQHDSIKLASASAEEQLVEQGTAAEQLADDLRCGMFSMAPVRASRPGGWEAASLSQCSCTTLHCTALHCTALHCTALHCTALHCTALHCTAHGCNSCGVC